MAHEVVPEGGRVIETSLAAEFPEGAWQQVARVQSAGCAYFVYSHDEDGCMDRNTVVVQADGPAPPRGPRPVILREKLTWRDAMAFVLAQVDRDCDWTRVPDPGTIPVKIEPVDALNDPMSAAGFTHQACTAAIAYEAYDDPATGVNQGIVAICVGTGPAAEREVELALQVINSGRERNGLARFVVAPRESTVTLKLAAEFFGEVKLVDGKPRFERFIVSPLASFAGFFGENGGAEVSTTKDATPEDEAAAVAYWVACNVDGSWPLDRIDWEE